MLRLDLVQARLVAKVPTLANRIGNAAELASLIERKQMPQMSPYAFVVPGGFAGGNVRSASGLFVQDFTEALWIALFVRSAADPQGAKALDTVTPLVRSVVNALCGWGPDDAPGVYALASGEPAGSEAGTLAFHLEFNLIDQLRIVP